MGVCLSVPGKELQKQGGDGQDEPGVPYQSRTGQQEDITIEEAETGKIQT